MEVIYRILNGLYPSYLNDIITVEELQHLRCQARLLVPRFSTIRYGKKSLSYLSPVLWNTLDNDIKQCNVLTAFKKRMQLWKRPACNCGCCAQCRISNRLSWMPMLMIINLMFCTRDIFFSFVYFVVNIVYFVVHVVCEVDVIANSLVLYLQFCSTLNKMFFFFYKQSLRGCDIITWCPQFKRLFCDHGRVTTLSKKWWLCTVECSRYLQIMLHAQVKGKTTAEYRDRHSPDLWNTFIGPYIYHTPFTPVTIHLRAIVLPREQALK